eukprot:CAMPEP_0198147872 /NCGR_PEP_ID=MMETSP1443-20131203/38266_1 /TAXON_ID=186043 /ORGANISM="Entomoneis sp., Strain CCMP2396" /LENGTH=474 /DNA_ID=CAMNT_0043812379 /DNA_START=209 /DNA_END=1630 /DNA_ORIENTATION=+
MSTATKIKVPSVAPTPGGGGGGDGSAGGAAHIWEETNVGNTWESAVVEDEQGRIVLQGANRDSLTALLRRRRRRLEQNDYALRNKRLRRDMIRYVYVIVDASRWMREKDPVVPPGTRLEATIGALQDFCQAYYDENPLSHLGFILIRNGEAEILSKLSSSSKPHKLALTSIGPLVANETGSSIGGGEFSLQNGLEVAGRSLGHQPRYGSREIVVVTAALSTCDPGFILTETLPRLQQARIRVSAFALSAELHVCRKITQETFGSMGVCLDKAHFREWLLNQTVPPPTHKNMSLNDSNNSNEDEDDEDGGGVSCEMVHMGFPSRTLALLPSLVHATREKTIMGRTSFNCPQCQAKNSELPADCAVCGLKLVLSPHLARSFHHLFPVPQFAEVAVAVADAAAGMVVESGKSGGLLSSAGASKTNVASSSSNAGAMGGGSLVLTNGLLVNSRQDDTCCFACVRPLLSTNAENGSAEW